MVLESYISTGLTKVLSTYIQDLSANQVTFLLTSGKFELHNVKLQIPTINKQLLSTSGIVLTDQCSIGRLKIGIQWSSILKNPFLVEIDDLHLVVAARPGYCLQQEDVEKMCQQAKQSALQALQDNLIGLSQVETPGEQKPLSAPPGAGILLKIVASIINSFEFRMTGLHIVVNHNLTLDKQVSQEQNKELCGFNLPQESTSDGTQSSNGVTSQSSTSEVHPAWREQANNTSQATTALSSADSSSSSRQQAYPILGIAMKRFNFVTAEDGVHKDIIIEECFAYLDAPQKGEGESQGKAVPLHQVVQREADRQLEQERANDADRIKRNAAIEQTTAMSSPSIYEAARAQHQSFLLYPFSHTTQLHFDRKAKEGMAIRCKSVVKEIALACGIAKLSDVGSIGKPIGLVSAQVQKYKSHYEHQWRDGDEQLRHEYIDLYKATLNALWLPAPTDESKQQLTQIEDRISTPTLEVWRTVAIAELRRELDEENATVMLRANAQSMPRKLVNFALNKITGKDYAPTLDRAPHELSTQDRQEIYDEVCTKGLLSAPAIGGPIDQVEDGDAAEEANDSELPAGTPAGDKALPILKPLKIDFDLQFQRISFDVRDDNQSITSAQDSIRVLLLNTRLFVDIHDKVADIQAGFESFYISDISKVGERSKSHNNRPVIEQFRHLVAIDKETKQQGKVQQSHGADQDSNNERSRSWSMSEKKNWVQQLPVFLSVQWRADGIDTVDSEHSEQVGHSRVPGATTQLLAQGNIDDSDASAATTTKLVVDIECTYLKVIVGPAIATVMKLLKADDESVRQKTQPDPKKVKRDALHQANEPFDVARDTLGTEDEDEEHSNRQPTQAPPTEEAPEAAEGSLAAMGVPNVMLPPLSSALPVFPLLLRVRIASPTIIAPIDPTDPTTVALIATATIAVTTRLTLTKSKADEFNRLVYFMSVATVINIISAQVYAYEYDLEKAGNQKLYARSRDDRYVHLTKLSIQHRLFPSHFQNQSTGPTVRQAHSSLPSTDNQQLTQAQQNAQSYAQIVRVELDPTHIKVASRLLFIALAVKDNIPLPSPKQLQPEIITQANRLEDEQDGDGEDSDSEQDHEPHKAVDHAASQQQSQPRQQQTPQQLIASLEQYVEQKELEDQKAEEDDQLKLENVLRGNSRLAEDESTNELIPVGPGSFNESNVHIYCSLFTLEVVDDTKQRPIEFVRIQVYEINVDAQSFMHNRTIKNEVSLRLDWYNADRCVYEPIIEPLTNSVEAVQTYTLPDTEIQEAAQIAMGKKTAVYPIISQITLQPSRYVDVTLSQEFLRSTFSFIAAITVTEQRRHKMKDNGESIMPSLRPKTDQMAGMKYRLENVTEVPVHFEWMSYAELGQRRSKDDQSDQHQDNKEFSKPLQRVVGQTEEPGSVDIDAVNQRKAEVLRKQSNKSQIRDLVETDVDASQEHDPTAEKWSEAQRLNRHVYDVPQLSDDAYMAEGYTAVLFGDKDDEDDDVNEQTLAIQIHNIGKPLAVSLLQPDTVKHTITHTHEGKGITVVIDIYVDSESGMRVVRVRGTTGVVNHTDTAMECKLTDVSTAVTIEAKKIWWLPIMPTERLPLQSVHMRPKESQGSQWSDAVHLQTSLRTDDAFFRQIIKCEASGAGQRSFAAVVHADNILRNLTPREDQPCIQLHDDGTDTHSETKNPSDMKSYQEPHKSTKESEVEIFGTLYCIHPTMKIQNLTSSRMLLEWGHAGNSKKQSLFQSVKEFDKSDPTAVKKPTNVAIDADDSKLMDRDDTYELHSADFTETISLTVSVPDRWPNYRSEALPLHIQDETQTILDKSVKKATKGKSKTMQIRMHSISADDKDMDEIYLTVDVTKIHGIAAYHVVVYDAYWLFNLTGCPLKLSSDGKTAFKRPVSDQSKLPHYTPPGKEEHDVVPLGVRMGIKHPGLHLSGVFDGSTHHWSDKIHIDRIRSATPQEIDVPSSGEKHCNPLYSVNAVVELGKGSYYRTKVITLQPSVFIVNTLDDDVELRQVDSNATSIIVPHKQQVAYHWATAHLDKKQPRMVEFRRSAPEFQGWKWSAPVDPNEKGDQTTIVRHASKPADLWFSRVQAASKSNCTFITLSEYTDNKLQSIEDSVYYKAVNHSTKYLMRFRQVLKTEEAEEIEEPGEDGKKKKAEKQKEKHPHHHYQLHKFNTSYNDDYLYVLPLDKQPYSWQYTVGGTEYLVVEISEYTTFPQLRWSAPTVVPIEDIDWHTAIRVGNQQLHLSVEVDGVAHVATLRDFPTEQVDKWTQSTLGLTAPLPMHSQEQLVQRHSELERSAVLLRSDIQQLEAHLDTMMAKIRTLPSQSTALQRAASKRAASKPRGSNQATVYVQLHSMSGRKLDKYGIDHFEVKVSVKTPNLSQQPQSVVLTHESWHRLQSANPSTVAEFRVYRVTSILGIKSRKLLGTQVMSIRDLAMTGSEPSEVNVQIPHPKHGRSDVIGILHLYVYSDQPAVSSSAAPAASANGATLESSIVQVSDIEDELLRLRPKLRLYEQQLTILQQRGANELNKRLEQEHKQQSGSKQEQQKAWTEYYVELVSIKQLQSLVDRALPDDMLVDRVTVLLSPSHAFAAQYGVTVYNRQSDGELDNEKFDLQPQPLSFNLPMELAGEEELQVDMYLYTLHKSTQPKDNDATAQDMVYLATHLPAPIRIATTTLSLRDIPTTTDHRETEKEDDLDDARQEKREKDKSDRGEDPNKHSKQGQDGNKNQNASESADGSVTVAGKQILLPATNQPIALDQKLNADSPDTSQGNGKHQSESEGKHNESKQEKHQSNGDGAKDDTFGSKVKRVFSKGEADDQKQDGKDKEQQTKRLSNFADDEDETYSKQQDERRYHTELRFTHDGHTAPLQVRIDKQLWGALKVRPHTTLSLYVPRAGISIVDGVPEEIIYISVDSFLMRVQLSSERLGLQLVCAGFQVDDQLPDSIFPVIVAMQPPETDEQDQQPNAPPLFQLALSQLTSYRKALVLDYLAFQLQPLDVKVDEVAAWRLIAMLLQAIQSQVESAQQPTRRSVDDYRSLFTEPSPALHAMIQSMVVQPISADISFEPSPAMRAEYANLRADYDLLLYAVSIGAAFTAVIEKAPVRVSGQQIDHINGTADVIVKSLLDTYKEQIIYQVLRVGGGLNILGQPSAAWQQLGSQDVEMVFDSKSGIKPSTSGQSKRKGASLPQRAWQAGFQSAGGFMSSIASGFAMLTLDQQYVKDKARSRHNQPTDLSTGMDKAADSARKGWKEGYAGLLSRPREAMKKQNEDESKPNETKPVAKAVASGVASAVFKPLSGMSGAAADALKGTAKLGDPSSGWVKKNKAEHTYAVDRVRPQRAIVSGVITEYTPNPYAVQRAAPRNAEQAEAGEKPDN